MGRQRGVALVMALLLVLLVGIIARAIIAVGPTYLAAVNQGEDLREARRAAEAGVSYALSRLKANPAWQGDGNGTVVDTPGLIVVEDRGNVLGLMRDLQGNVSTFRLRFNYQDGPAGADGLDDPAPEHLLKTIYVSLNNTQGTSPKPVPRADATSYVVGANPTIAYDLAAKAFCLLVEGRAGPGLRDMTQPAAAEGFGRVARQTVECLYQHTLSQRAQDAPLMGGGDLNFRLPETGFGPPNTAKEVHVGSRNGSAKPRLRSKRGVHVSQGTADGRLTMDTGSGEVCRDATCGFSADLASPVTQVDETLGDGKDFYNLKWSDVSRADADPATKKAVQIPGGTYVHWDDGSIHYYDMKFADYQTFMNEPANQSDPGTTIRSSNLQELRTAENLGGGLATGLRVGQGLWEVKKDLCVVSSSSGVKDFAVLPRGGRKLTATDTSLTVAGPAIWARPDFQVTNAIMSVPGDTHLMASLKGQGATFTAEGNMTVASREVRVDISTRWGGTQTVTQPQGLNFYVKKDLTISSWQADNTFQSIYIDGLVYCWGNFRGIAGAEGTSQWGEFDLDGALVAYGGDPESANPGSSGGGSIDISAWLVDLTWDGKNLASITDVERVPTTLRRTLYVSH